MPEEIQNNRITQILYKGDGSDKIADIGASFDNVFFEDEDNFFTLQDLYSFLENFFKKGTFITYSEEEPSDESIRI
jgi:hypothetical protein